MSRPVSPATVAVRELLTERKGEITFSEAQPVLQAKGFPVESPYFNAVKMAWKRSQTPAESKPRKTRRLPTVDPQEAVKYVLENGGLRQVVKNIQRQQAMVKAFKQVVRQAA